MTYKLSRIEVFMKVTGNDLILALEQHKFRLDALKQEFNDCLHAFPGEVKRAPEEVMKEIVTEETSVAFLQSAQAEYNSKVKVTVIGRGIPEETLRLSEAIKMAGAIERVHAMWKAATLDKSPGHRYFDSELVRDPNQVRASRTLDVRVANEKAAYTKLYQRAIRGAISVANRLTVELENLEPSLLD